MIPQVDFFSLFGRIEDTIIRFRDLLTFTFVPNQLGILITTVSCPLPRRGVTENCRKFKLGKTQATSSPFAPTVRCSKDYCTALVQDPTL